MKIAWRMVSMECDKGRKEVKKWTYKDGDGSTSSQFPNIFLLKPLEDEIL